MTELSKHGRSQINNKRQRNEETKQNESKINIFKLETANERVNPFQLFKSRESTLIFLATLVSGFVTADK